MDALSTICIRESAEEYGRDLVTRLKEHIDRQQYEVSILTMSCAWSRVEVGSSQVVIQATMGTKILARERITPYRKDVLMKSGKMVGNMLVPLSHWSLLTSRTFVS